MSDEEYDQLIELIASHPEWDDRGVTSSVASGALGTSTVKHPTPMLSLGKQADKLALTKIAFGAKLIVEPKLDGMAVRVAYRNGNLELAATRGDGLSGEDITLQVRRGVNGLPTKLSSDFSGDVRGEIFMTDTDFDLANQVRTSSGKRAFMNPRNATAGTLRDSDPDLRIPLSFAAYDVESDELQDDSYQEQMKALSGIGIATACLLVDGLSDMDVLAGVDYLESVRPTLGFPIDGAVVKADSIAKRRELGSNSHVPRWAAAFKYAPDTARTVIRDIEVSVGRTGRLGFRFLVDPVEVGGTTVRYATAHNADWIVANDLRIGDTVWVYRAGDVIPRITTAIVEARTPAIVPWSPPASCPQCGDPLDKSSIIWRCTTPECSTVGRIVYFAERDCMDIEGLDEAISEALVEAGLVRDIADIYDLTVDQLANLSLSNNRQVGTKVAEKLIASIKASKQQPFNRVITALGIRSTGRSVGRWLASSFVNMDNLQRASVQDVAQIDKLGDVKATNIVNGLRDMASVIERLREHGVTMSQAEPTGDNLPLAGQTIVVSGVVPGYTRTSISERIVALGGTVSSSVSKNTTALVTSETTTSKAVKAAELGVRVIAPADFVAMID